MLKLDLPVEPFWADLPHGVRVRIKPVTTAIVSAAQHRAARLGREAAEAAGGELDPDISRGLAFVLMAKALARFAIEGWEGVVGPDDAPLPLTGDAAERLMDIEAMASAFWDAALRPVQAVSAEGNG
jgi:hypothetical protein